MVIWVGSEDISEAIAIKYHIKHEALDKGRGHNEQSSNSIQNMTAPDGQSRRDSPSNSKREL